MTGYPNFEDYEFPLKLIYFTIDLKKKISISRIKKKIHKMYFDSNPDDSDFAYHPDSTCVFLLDECVVRILYFHGIIYEF